MVNVLTIAGSDPSGGAGIQADLKTFAALKVYGASVVTAVTAQNSAGVRGILEVKENFVAMQLDSVLSDLKIDAVKIGMLYNKGIIAVVTQKLIEYRLRNIVLDPVMYSKTGDPLLKEDAQSTMKEQLIPVCNVITPNLSEAQKLSGISINNVEDMKKASMRIFSLGCKAVIIKGGHLVGDAVDLLYDGEEFVVHKRERIAEKNPHGAGCTFSSAVAAWLALGLSLGEAFKKAKEYVTDAIRSSFSLGHGFDLLNHMYNLF